MSTNSQNFPSFPRSTTHPRHENMPGLNIEERVDVEGVTNTTPSSAIKSTALPSTLHTLLSSLSRFFDRTVQEPYKRHTRNRENQEEYLQTLYERFRERGIEEYPECWPQFAAFLNSADNFAIFRRFGLVHCRVLVYLQAEIQLLKQQLSELDNSDSEPGAPNLWRLQTAEYDESWDPAQQEILKQLQEKLVVHDNLLPNEQNLRKLGQPLEGSHRSVFHWIMRKRPFHKGQYNWIYHAADFIPQSQVPRFESAIFAYFRPFFDISRATSIVHHCSLQRVSSFAKLATVLVTVGVLIVPISVLLWIPMSRASVISTVILSVLSFSGIMSLTTTLEVRHILIGAATYCAVLATFLGKTPEKGSDKV